MQHRAHGAAPGVGVPAPQVGLSLGVGVADEPLDALLHLTLSLTFAELLLEARHHACQEAAAVAIGSYGPRLFVVAPEALGGLGQEPLDIRGDVEVGRGPAELQRRAAPSLERNVRRDPDGAHEEVPAEDPGQDALAGVAARLDGTDLTDVIVARRGGGGRVDVVDEHQSARLVHRCFGLVQVRAVREREQAHDPAQDRVSLVGLPVTAPRQPRRSRVERMLAAYAREGGTVRGFVVNAERLVDVLVRHLVLENLANDAPWLLEDQLARQGDGAVKAIPTAESSGALGEGEDGRAECLRELAAGQLFPGGSDLPQQRPLEKHARLRIGSDHAVDILDRRRPRRLLCHVMSKSQDAKKNVKKAPTRTPKEKKELKRLKKAGK